MYVYNYKNQLTVHPVTGVYVHTVRIVSMHQNSKQQLLGKWVLPCQCSSSEQVIDESHHSCIDTYV